MDLVSSNAKPNYSADSVLTRGDIYNARALVNRQKLDSYNPTATLIKIFDKKGVSDAVKWLEASFQFLADGIPDASGCAACAKLGKTTVKSQT